MARVRIYTTNYCGYCNAAKRFLAQAKGVEFEEIDVSYDPDTRRWLVEATGQSTVPQIFVGDQAIGGYTDLAALEAKLPGVSEKVQFIEALLQPVSSRELRRRIAAGEMYRYYITPEVFDYIETNQLYR